MNTAQTLRFNGAQAAIPARKPATASPRARPVPPAPAQLASTPVRHPKSFPSGRENLGLVAFAAVLHALVVWSVLQASDAPRLVTRATQEIELLRPAPPVIPEAIKPAPKPLEPPPRKLDAPKPVQQAATTPAALRTQVATTEAVPADVPTVAENLQAAKTTGPVVAAAPAVVAEPPAPPKEEPVTEPNAYAAYLNNPPPVYPKAAQRQGLQGRVLLRVHVLASGQVGTVELKQSSGKPLLDEAALAAVKAWTFAPALKGKTPVDAWSTVPIDFRMS
ncbi:MAG: TonB family protein [Pseudomonadota bacterium]